jgi:hypothetical protein
LEAFKESIAYDVTVHELLKRYSVLTTREQGFAQSILANWQSLPLNALPTELHPPKFGRDLLQFLSRLSKMCSLDKVVLTQRAKPAAWPCAAQYKSLAQCKINKIFNFQATLPAQTQWKITGAMGKLKAVLRRPFLQYRMT